MKVTLSVLMAAGLILAIVAFELGFGIKWSLDSHRLPDRDLKPIRPVARLVLTGVVTSMTILFGVALLRTLRHDD